MPAIPMIAFPPGRLPAYRRTMRIVVCRVADFPSGARRIIIHGRRSIGVFRVGERFYALNNHCPHSGGPLCEGRTQAWVRSTGPGDFRVDEADTMIACPWHGWEYDMATGQSFLGPGAPPARAYEVRVEPGPDGRRPGPYVAETFDVDIEQVGADAHVVVETTPRAATGGAR
jgi:nitrite reductase/ring-hydroxylating ferredoxin subunit